MILKALPFDTSNLKRMIERHSFPMLFLRISLCKNGKITLHVLHNSSKQPSKSQIQFFQVRRSLQEVAIFYICVVFLVSASVEPHLGI